jgi:hypothetical protein
VAIIGLPKLDFVKHTPLCFTGAAAPFVILGGQPPRNLNFEIDEIEACGGS